MQQQQFDNSGFQQNDNTHPNAGRHGAEAGALAGGVGGHQGGHTVRDAAVGGAAGGAAGHEVHKHDENKTGTNEDQSGQKPGLMAKVKGADTGFPFLSRDCSDGADGRIHF